MRYLVTGATGFIGSHLVERLVDDGHDVVTLTRERSNADHLPAAVEVAEADITEKGSMRDAMEGVDGVFHLAAWWQVGPGPWNAERAERINVDGTRNVLELVDELGVPKGVYASTVAVYANAGDEVVDESYRSPNAFPTVYQRTKWRAHYEVADPMIDEGLPIVIATLGAIYGPGDKDYGGTPRTAFQDYLRGDLPMVPRDFAFPWVYVEDAARSLHRAMDAGAPGEEYVVGDGARSLAEAFEVAEGITGVPLPRTVSPAVFRWLGHAVAGLEWVAKPPTGFESELLRFFGSGERLAVDGSKAERELGVEHRSLEAGLEEYLDWELEQLDLQLPTG